MRNRRLDVAHAFLRAVSPFVVTSSRTDNRVCADADRNVRAPAGPPGSLRYADWTALAACLMFEPRLRGLLEAGQSFYGWLGRPSHVSSGSSFERAFYRARLL